MTGAWYQRCGGENFARTVLLTCVVFAGPAFAVWSLLNTVAILYGSTAAFPFGYIIFIIGAWGFVTVPLTIAGASFGRHRALRDLRNSKFESYFPCRTNKLERMIPGETGVVFPSRLPRFLLAGALPFVSIYVEIHYILDSTWSYASYSAYGILLTASLLTLLNLSLLTLVFLYLQLNAENWRWWWPAFLSGGAVKKAVFPCALVLRSAIQKKSYVAQCRFVVSGRLVGGRLVGGVSLGGVSWGGGGWGDA